MEMKKWRGDEIVGHVDGKVTTGPNEVYFSDLREDYQIGLQNADKWELWQQNALNAQKDYQKETSKNYELTEKIRLKDGEIKDLYSLCRKYEEALLKIINKSDSLLWSKEIATEAICNPEDLYPFDEGK